MRCDVKAPTDLMIAPPLTQGPTFTSMNEAYQVGRYNTRFVTPYVAKTDTQTLIVFPIDIARHDSLTH